MFLLLTFFVFLAIIVADYFNKKHRYDVVAKSKIPGKPPLPLIGNALDIRHLNNVNITSFFEEILSNKEKTYHFWNFSRLVLVSSHVKTIEILLCSQKLIQKAFGAECLSIWLGDGLLTTRGKKWHQRRKIITPTFHFKILEQFVKIFDQQSSILVNKLAELADGKTTVDIYPIVCRTALDIIMESAMGISVKAQDNPDFEYVKAVQETCEILADRIRKPGMTSGLLYAICFPKKHKLLQQNIKLMHNFTKNVIVKRRAALKQRLKNNEEIEDDFGARKREAFLDVLLQATVDGEPLNNEDICEEVETFMFAGHDTTTSAVSFVLYMISRHPEVQQKIFDEIRNVMGDEKQRPATLRDLSELHYLDCVIRESFRFYPPVPIIGRSFNEDVDLNGVVYPGGTQFNIAIHVMLQDPDNFSNPKLFNPDRFSVDSNEKIDPFSFIPFSAGPRNCIGQKFALLEIKSTVSKMLRYFQVLPFGDEPLITSSFTLRSLNGVNLGMIKRNYA